MTEENDDVPYLIHKFDQAIRNADEFDQVFTTTRWRRIPFLRGFANRKLDEGYREELTEINALYSELGHKLERDLDLQAYRTAFHDEAVRVSRR